MSGIIRANDMDLSGISFSDVRTLDNGGKMINISYNGQKLFMQLPSLIANYGLSVWPSDKGGYDKVHLDLSLTGYDGTNPNVKTFFDKMTQFDELLINTAMANSKAWFRKIIANRDIAQAVFTPLVKFSKDKVTSEISTQYPPVIRLQIPRNKNGEIDIEIYDASRNRLKFDDVDFKKAAVTAIVQVSSVWLISGKFGVTMKVQQMKINQSQSKLSTFAFVDDSDDDVDN